MLQPGHTERAMGCLVAPCMLFPLALGNQPARPQCEAHLEPAIVSTRIPQGPVSAWPPSMTECASPSDTAWSISEQHWLFRGSFWDSEDPHLSPSTSCSACGQCCPPRPHRPLFSMTDLQVFEISTLVSLGWALSQDKHSRSQESAAGTLEAASLPLANSTLGASAGDGVGVRTPGRG